VWYLVDDDGQLKGSITSDRQKFKNLRGNPNCDLFIIDSQNPFRTLEVRAEAELTADPDKTTVRKFAKVYNVDESMLVQENEDRYTVTYRPRRVVANPPVAAEVTQRGRRPTSWRCRCDPRSVRRGRLERP